MNSARAMVLAFTFFMTGKINGVMPSTVPIDEIVCPTGCFQPFAFYV
jgi:heme/copper-type cytochrome/quinol oxidase subunit 1